MAQTWDIDPKSGDYILDNGRPVQTDSLRVPAYLRLKINRSRWLYAPASNYGSNFYSIQKRKSTEDATFLENTAAEALQPIIDNDRAKSITVTTTQAARYGVGLNVVIEENSGDTQELNLPSIP